MNIYLLSFLFFNICGGSIMLLVESFKRKTVGSGPDADMMCYLARLVLGFSIVSSMVAYFGLTFWTASARHFSNYYGHGVIAFLAMWLVGIIVLFAALGMVAAFAAAVGPD